MTRSLFFRNVIIDDIIDVSYKYIHLSFFNFFTISIFVSILFVCLFPLTLADILVAFVFTAHNL